MQKSKWFTLIKSLRKRCSPKMGFTLIELMVVIAAIGLVAGVVFVSLGGARESADDAKRKAEVREIEKLLLIYYNSVGNGQFPGEAWCDSSAGSCANACPCSPAQNDWSTSSAIWQGIVGNSLAPSLPVDPVNDAVHYYYYEPDCNDGDCPGEGCCLYRICASRLDVTGSGYCLSGQP